MNDYRKTIETIAGVGEQPGVQMITPENMDKLVTGMSEADAMRFREKMEPHVIDCN